MCLHLGFHVEYFSRHWELTLRNRNGLEAISVPTGSTKGGHQGVPTGSILFHKNWVECEKAATGSLLQSCGGDYKIGLEREERA